MKISIVTPSLNQGRYLREALESVRAQGHEEIEHLVMDGGSQDETIPLLLSTDGQKEWKHLSWQTGLDGGQSDALNRGFSRATGDIVGWLNSDDRYRAGCFDHVVKMFAENTDIDIVYGDFAEMNEGGSLLRIRREIEFNRFVLLYHRVSYIPTAATFFRRRIFDDGNFLRSELHYAMDYEFFLRLAASGYRFQHMSCVLADFRLHRLSKSCSGELAQAEEKRQIMSAASPIGRWPVSLGVRRIAFLGMQWTAGMLRYSEKTLRGYYSLTPISLDETEKSLRPGA